MSVPAHTAPSARDHQLFDMPDSNARVLAAGLRPPCVVQTVSYKYDKYDFDSHTSMKSMITKFLSKSIDYNRLRITAPVGAQ